MIGYLIYNKTEALRNSWFITQLINEGLIRGAEIRLLIEENIMLSLTDGFGIYYEGQKLEKPDFVIARVQNFTLSSHFEYMGARVFNNSYVSLVCNNKMLTYQLAKKLSLPIMETFLAPQNSEILYDALPHPCVIKPVDGKGGSDVYLIKDEKQFESLRPHFIGKEMLIQTLASDTGRDTRIYVMSGRIIAAFTRISTNDFRSNFCLGGSALPHKVTSDEADAVEKLCSVLHPDFVGIDFVYHNGKAVFNEIEDVVGSRMIYASTDINVAGMYIEHILSCL